jgi:hypothetical protein
MNTYIYIYTHSNYKPNDLQFGTLEAYLFTKNDKPSYKTQA